MSRLAVGYLREHPWAPLEVDAEYARCLSIAAKLVPNNADIAAFKYEVGVFVVPSGAWTTSQVRRAFRRLVKPGSP